MSFKKYNPVYIIFLPYEWLVKFRQQEMLIPTFSFSYGRYFDILYWSFIFK